MDNQITKNTPISVALVLAMCAGSYWTGCELTSIRADVVHVGEQASELKELTKEVTTLVSDNKRRLDLMERAK